MAVTPEAEREALASLFWTRWTEANPTGAAPSPGRPPELGATLERAVGRGVQAWPRVKLLPGTFVARLAGHAAALPASQLVEGLAGLHLEDLYLACACLEHDRAALDELEGRFLAPLRLRRMPGLGESQLDEVRDLLRERLLLATADSPPRLERYSGQGPLGAWIQVVAVRLALNQARDVRREEASEEAARVSAAVFVSEVDPEVAYLKRCHQEDFAAAFREAMQALSLRERYLLRLHLCDRLGVDRIGALEGVHRATAARWLAAAREHLHDETLRRLQARLRSSTGEVQSLLRLLQSELDVSVSRYLADRSDATSD